jgi:hypothetical protein
MSAYHNRPLPAVTRLSAGFDWKRGWIRGRTEVGHLPVGMTGAREEDGRVVLASSLELDDRSAQEVWSGRAPGLEGERPAAGMTSNVIWRQTANGAIWRLSPCIPTGTVSRKRLSGGVLAMRSLRAQGPGNGSGNGNGNGNGHGNGHGHQAGGHGSVGKMTLLEAAQVIERLQVRAAHTAELEALRIARDAVLTIVSEGFLTLKDRLEGDGIPVRLGCESGAAAGSGQAATVAHD